MTPKLCFDDRDLLYLPTILPEILSMTSFRNQISQYILRTRNICFILSNSHIIFLKYRNENVIESSWVDFLHLSDARLQNRMIKLRFISSCKFQDLDPCQFLCYDFSRSQRWFLNRKVVWEKRFGNSEYCVRLHRVWWQSWGKLLGKLVYIE